jgi:hypothetical protein
MEMRAQAHRFVFKKLRRTDVSEPAVKAMLL